MAEILTRDNLHLEFMDFAENELQNQLYETSVAIRQAVAHDMRTILMKSLPQRGAPAAQTQTPQQTPAGDPSQQSHGHVESPQSFHLQGHGKSIQAQLLVPGEQSLSMQSARAADVYQLPGQPGVMETIPAEPDMESMENVGSPMQAPWKTVPDWPPAPLLHARNSRSRTLDRACDTEAAIKRNLYKQAATTALEVEDTSQVRLTKMRTAIPCTPNLKEELERLDYFGMVRQRSMCSVESACSVKSFEAMNEELTNEVDNLPEIVKAKDAMLRLNSSHSQNFVSKLHNQEYQEFAKQNRFTKLVCNNYFEYGVLLIICINALCICVQAEVAVYDHAASQTTLFKAIDGFFLFVFAIELGLRLHVFRTWFFANRMPWGDRNTNKTWNALDCFIVISQALEMIIQALTDDNQYGSLTILRLLRFLRIGRLCRVGKVVQWFSSLRAIVSTVYHSLQLFFWSVISLALITLVFAIYFTEIAALEFHKGDEDPDLKHFFGSLALSQLSLYKAVTGGIDWGELEELLRDIDFTFAALPFLCYLTFMMIVIMNVFAGIFLDSASQMAREETEMHLVRNAFDIFRSSNVDGLGSGQITKADFEKILANADVNSFFDAIDLDVHQAEVLFELLDVSNDGLISCDEFLRGCLRLHGSAKALDLLILSREVSQNFDVIKTICKANYQVFQSLVKELHTDGMMSKVPSNKASSPSKKTLH